MTLKYPKKTGDKSNGSRRKAESAESGHLQEQQQQHHNQAWASHQHYPDYHPVHDYTTHFGDSQTTLQYAPEYYSAKPKPPLSLAERSGGTEQLLSPMYTESPALTNQVENCDWSPSTNHELAKPVGLTYLVVGDENNNNQHYSQQQQPWLTTEFASDIKGDCQNNGGASALHQAAAVAIPSEFVNYDQHTGFPPSISSNASTLSSPTTSTDYNFNYQFDTFNSSVSNDTFDTSYPPQIMDTFEGYEATTAAAIPVDGEVAYHQQIELTTNSCQWAAAADVYEPNYYPFANGIEKMIY